MTASNEFSANYIALTSICIYLKLGPFYLYNSFMALMEVCDISIFVILSYPSSNISSLSPLSMIIVLEFPDPTFKILNYMGMFAPTISRRVKYRWYQSKSPGSREYLSYQYYARPYWLISFNYRVIIIIHARSSKINNSFMNEVYWEN